MITDDRTYWFREYHKTLRVIVAHGIDSQEGLAAWDPCVQAEQKYQALDLVLDTLRNSTWDELLQQFRDECTPNQVTP